MSFFGGFFGSDQRRALKKGYQDSSRMLREGYEQGRGDMEGYYGKAMGYLDPWVQGGGRANALYLDYIGANGPEAQKAAFAAFQNDPGFQQQMGAGINALDRSATARGGLYSGAAMKGVQEFGQQFQRQAFNDRMGQLGQASGQGQQAAMGAAGLTSQTGNALGNLAWGYGQQNAANRINFANGMAQAAGIGPQNMLNFAGTLVKAFGMPGMPGGGGPGGGNNLQKFF